MTRIKTLVPQVDTVLTEGLQLVDRWTEPGVCLLQPPTFHTECGKKKTPDIQEGSLKRSEGRFRQEPTEMKTSAG